MFGLIKVSGDSMSPTLMPGDYILTKKPRRIAAGLIYVIQNDRRGRIIKRLTKLTDDTATYESDNPEGISGEASLDQITRHVWLAITPKGVKKL